MTALLPTPVPPLALESAPGRGRPRVAGAVHRGALRPGIVLLDAALLALACVLTNLSLAFVPLAVAALLLSGRVYRDRDRVVARGVAWWPRLLAGPLLVAGLVTTVLVDETAQQALYGGLAGTGLLLLARATAWRIVLAARRGGRDLAPCLVVGGGDRAATIARTLERHPDFGLAVTVRLGSEILADPTALAGVLRELQIEHVLLVADGAATATAAPMRRSLGIRAHLSLVPTVSDALLTARAGRRIGGIAVLPLGRPLLGPGRLWGKRALDLVGATVLLLLSAPLLGLAALAIRVVDGGPVFYRQQRTGRFGVPFQIIKLRTMRVGAHGEQGRLTTYNTSDGLLFKMSADPRVTRTGSFLRLSGLDELPQLLNVLSGQMSLVGPRPLPVESEAFSVRDGERHLVPPGMTGLWQVSGGSSLRYREMVDLDLAYVHTWSVGLDLRVLLATLGVLVGAVLRRR